MSEFSSGRSRSDRSSWKANIVDWEFESDETDPSIIFHNSLDMDDDDASIKEKKI